MHKRNCSVFVLIAIALIFANTIFVDPTFAQNDSIIPSFNIQEKLSVALKWIESLGYIGGIAFVIIYIIATVAFVPGSALTLGAGVVFGVGWGSLYVFIGATLGAIAAFLVGRYLARDWISKKLEGNQQFVAIDKAVAISGFKIVLLARLSPVFPFNLLNYALGVTGVSLKDYSLASVGMLPATVMFVYIGSLSSDIARIGSDENSTNTIKWAIRIIGFIATVAITIYATQIAKKAIAEIDN